MLSYTINMRRINLFGHSHSISLKIFEFNFNQIPGFAEARGDIEKYVGGKKGYKKNKYKYDDRTVQLVQDNWNFALDQWNYEL